MPIRKNFNCGCGFNSSNEMEAIEHVKKTGHEVHGHVRILTQNQAQRKESRPVRGIVVNGKFRPQEA